MTAINQRDRILQMARIKPILPMQLAPALNINTLFASAMLSELVSKGALRVSNIKVGSSPVYYIPGDEGKLLLFKEYLNDKDRKVLEFLQEKKVLCDVEQDPLVKVSLRGLRDFAFMFMHDSKEYWRFVLVSEDEAKKLVSGVVEPAPVQVVEQKPIVAEPVVSKVVDVKPEVLDPVVPKIERVKPQRSVQVKLEKPKLEGVVKKDFVSVLFDGVVVLSKEVFKSYESYVVEVPTALGNVRMLCHVRLKKKVVDADVTQLFTSARILNCIPVLVTNGKLAKSALDMAVKANVLVKEVGS